MTCDIIQSALKRRSLSVLIAALGLYAAAGFWLAPALMQHYGPAHLSETLRRPVTLDAIRVNPFTLALEARGVTVSEPDGSTILNLQGIRLDLDAVASLFSQTLTLDELQLEGASIHLIRTAAGKLNLTQLHEDISITPRTDAPTLQFGIQHLWISDGAVMLTDESHQPPLTLSVEHLDLDINDLSTQFSQHSIFTMEAHLPEQGTMTGRGELSLNPLMSSGTVDIEGLNITEVWKLMRDRLAIAPPEGRMDLSAHYIFTPLEEGQSTLNLSQGRARIRALKLSDTGQQPLLHLDTLDFEGLDANLGDQTITLASLKMLKGGVRVNRGEMGQLNWQSVVLPPPTSAGPTAAVPTEASPWKLALKQLDIEGVALDYTDTHRKRPLKASVSNLALSLKANGEVSGTTYRGLIEDTSVHLEQFSISPSENPDSILALDSATLRGGTVDLEKRTAGFRQLEIQGGSATLARTAAGEIQPLDWLAAPTRTESSTNIGDTGPGLQKQPETTPELPSWRVSLDEIILQGLDLAVTDAVHTPALRLDLDNIRMTARQFSTDGAAPVTIESTLGIRQGGTVFLKGEARPDTLNIRADITLDKVNAVPFRSVVGQFAALLLEDGELSAQLALNHEGSTTPKPSTQLTGNARLDHLRLVHEKDKRAFLAWKSFDASGIDVRLAPDALSIKSLRLTEPDAVLAIYEDKSTNLSAILASRKPVPATKPARQPITPEVLPSLPVTIDRMVIDNGRMDFSDASLLLPFATRIDHLEGSITGIGSTPQNRAKLKLTGDINQFGEMVANGSLAPLDVKGFSNFNILFENIEMTSLSPYSATFAGRKIRSGKMNLDVNYTLENHQLQSESHLVLDQFALGETVPSPHASSLPLDFAISLLTDSDGKIKVSVPMSGSVDKAGFSYGDMVLDAIGTMISNVATAPFNALGSLLGDDADQMGLIYFDPGRASLPPHEREKLVRLASALASRDRLQLVIHGRYDTQLDGAALRDLRCRRAVADTLEIELKPGEIPDELNFTNASTQRALEKLARMHDDLTEIVSKHYEKATGHPPSRISLVAGLLGKASATPDFYERLYVELVKRTPLVTGELEALANHRSQILLEDLNKRGPFSTNRLSVGTIEAAESAPDERHVKTRLELLAK